MNIKSEKVYMETYRYTSIGLPQKCTPEEYDDAYAELNVFRKGYYGDDLNGASEIEVFVTETGETILRFATTYEMNGTSLNPLTHPNAVSARSLM